MKPLKLTLLITIAVLVLSTISFAEIPHSINYQGKLTDPSGSPVFDGTYSVTFRIYDVQAGGSPLWYETQYITTEKGLFSTQIGATKDLDLTFDKPYYLGMQVGSDAEMTPRQALSSSAYAFHAQTLDTVLPVSKGGTGSTAEANKANGVVMLDSSAKLPPESISGIFGAWTSKSFGTVYKAATDGFVVAISGSSSASGSHVQIYTDSSNPPTTLRAQAGLSPTSGIGGLYQSALCPVRKNDYWRVVHVGGVAVYWIPLGS